MSLCFSRKAVAGFVLATVFIWFSGCVGDRYHLVCYTDPPHCAPCRRDEPRVSQLEKVMDVTFADPDKSPDGKIPYYKFYSPDGVLLYEGHNLDRVQP